MRWVVGICLSAVLCIAFAGAASSGALGTPFNSDVCGGATVALDSMQDPNNLYSGLGSPQLCEKLCNRASKQCRSYVKKNTSCFNRFVNENLGWDKQNCDVIYDEDAESRKLCKEDAKEEADEGKQIIALFRDSGLEDCDEWGETCASTCFPL